jgi:hypothetical protein
MTEPDPLAEVLAAAIQADPATDVPRWEARRLGRYLAAVLHARPALLPGETTATEERAR